MDDPREEEKVLALAVRLGLASDAAGASALSPPIREALRVLAGSIPGDATEADLRKTIALLPGVRDSIPPTEATTHPVPAPSAAADLATLPVQAGVVGAPPTRLFGRYEVLDEIGRGGMGIVYRARQAGLDRVVALKVMIAGEHADEGTLGLFLREARATARLDHPNIVHVYDVGREGSQHYFTMRYVEGRALSEALGSGALSVRDGVDLVRKVALALEYAHAHGVIHRDVKPGNILLDPSGEPCLVDFGLAKDVSAEGLTVGGALLGTPSFASPEQAGNPERVGPLSDVYSLGATLYQILTGRPPFTGEGALEVLRQVLYEEPEAPRRIRPEVPSEIEAICLKALEKEPRRRYGSAGEMAGDLDRFLAGEPVHARPISAAERAWRQARRHRGVLIAASVAAIVGISAALWAWSSDRRADQRESAARAQDEALRLSEQARGALELAERLLYDPEATYDALEKRARAALSIADRASRAAPGLPQARVLAGRAWELIGDDGKAEAQYREAIRLDPGYGPARYRLGKLLMDRADLRGLTGRPWAYAQSRKDTARLSEEAAAEFAQAWAGADFEDPLPRLLCAAVRAYALDTIDEALRQAKAGVERFPGVNGVEEFYILMGECSSGEERARAFDEAIRRRPFHPMARFLRSCDRVKAGDHKAAIVDLDAALKLRPRFVQALLNRGVSRRDLGDLAGAGADFDEALRIRPGFPEALYARGLLRGDQGLTDAAERDFEESIAVDPEFAPSFVGRGSLRIARKDLDGGIADYDAALRIAPDLAPALGNRGWARDAKGDIKGAIEDYTKYLEFEPGSSRFLSARGIARNKQGDESGALADFEAAIAADRDCYVAFAERGILRKNAGDVAGAIADYTEALRIEPGMIEARINRGLAQLDRGEFDRAVSDFDAVLEAAPPGWPHRGQVEAWRAEARSMSGRR